MSGSKVIVGFVLSSALDIKVSSSETSIFCFAVPFFVLSLYHASFEYPAFTVILGKVIWHVFPGSCSLYAVPAIHVFCSSPISDTPSPFW